MGPGRTYAYDVIVEAFVDVVKGIMKLLARSKLLSTLIVELVFVVKMVFKSLTRENSILLFRTAQEKQKQKSRWMVKTGRHCSR